MEGNDEDGLLDEVDVPISAIEHYSYCPRQCALIHVEQTFDENLYTLRGRQFHERVHEEGSAAEEGKEIERGVQLWSERLGLIGKADVVEMRPEGPYPIEYKIGRHHGRHADLQLCAQAICLEEMMGVDVPRGAVFHHASRRRREVEFTPELRAKVEAIAASIRAMLGQQEITPPRNDRRCRLCSLRDSCLPATVAEPARLRGLQGALFVAATSEEDGDA